MTKEYEQLVAELKNSVIRELAEECGKSEKEAKEITRNIRLPSGETSMKFARDGDTVQITMSMEGVEYKRPPQRGKKKPSFINMQADDAAFEGWALALHVHLNKNIQLELDTNGEAVPAWDREKPHYNRFLYRLKKFDTLYGGPDGWFTVEENLSAAAEDFDRYLHASVVTFRNNIGTKSASVRQGAEARAEAAFYASPDKLSAYSKDLSRQLPVGLFEGTIKKETGIFTGGSSAIDLWGLGGDASGTQMVIYELKTLKRQKSSGPSAKVGIISELMFYAHYAYDMYLERKGFQPTPPKNGKDPRGYRRLAEANIIGIRAYMLTDKLHPLITPNVLKEMNRGSVRCHQALEYEALCYDWQVKGEEIVINSVKNWF